LLIDKLRWRRWPVAPLSRVVPSPLAGEGAMVCPQV